MRPAEEDGYTSVILSLSKSNNNDCLIAMTLALEEEMKR